MRSSGRDKDCRALWIANHFTFEVNFKLTTQDNTDVPFFAPVRLNKLTSELGNAQFFIVTR